MITIKIARVSQSEGEERNVTSVRFTSLSFPAKRQRVSSEPRRATRTTDRLRVSVSFAQTARTPTSRRLSTKFTVFMNRVTHPVHLWIVANRLMRRVHQNNFVIFVRRVLGNPVTVQHSQTAAATTDAFLSHGLQFSGWFQLIYSVTLGLAVSGTLRYWTFTTTSPHANSEYHEALLSFVA